MKAIFLGLLSFFVIISTGYAQECETEILVERPGMHKLHLEKRFELLDLSIEQREKVDAIKDETKKKIIPLRAEIALKRIDLENEMEEAEPNRSRLMKLTKEISDLQLKIKQTKIDEKL